MVEATILFKMLPASIIDTYKVVEHIDMLSIGMGQQPYSVIPTLLSSDYGDLGHLWSQHDVITSWLRLLSYSNCLSHPYKTHTTCWSTFICCPKAYSSSLASCLVITLLGSNFDDLGHLWSQHDVTRLRLKLGRFFVQAF